MKRHVARRLPLSPVFTRQLAEMPLNFANPVWVRADKVDLDRHIHRIRLPRPGTQRQLEAAVARMHAKCMPRDRPLWAFHIFEGLQSGDLALYTKVHHATLDGAAGVAFAQALLDFTPKPRKVARAPARSGEHPSLADLVGTAVRTTGVQGVKVIKQLPQLATALARLVKGGGAGFGRNLAFGPRTGFNGQIDAPRSFATASLPLDRVKQVAAAHGATINEVVLTVIGGALRGYLDAHGGVPRKSLIAAVPVSLREAGNTEATTLATMTLASLATDIEDPAARLVEVRAASAAAKAVMKQLRGAVPTDFPSLGLPWLLSAAAGALRPTRRRQPHPADREPRGLQRARAADAVLPGRRAPEDLLAGVDRRARARTQHHPAELRRVAGLRAHRGPLRAARPAPGGAGPARGLRRAGSGAHRRCRDPKRSGRLRA